MDVLERLSLTTTDTILITSFLPYLYTAPGMNISIWDVANEVNEWTVTRKLASILHSEDFAPVVAGRVMNFAVKLEYSDPGSIRNNGKGILTLPSEAMGNKFLAYVASLSPKDVTERLKLGGRKLKFRKSNRPPPNGQTLTLLKTPYVDPDIEEERLLKVRQLDDSILRIDAVQFGIFYQANYPASGKAPTSPRAFSVEWERDYAQDSYGSLKFEYDHKLIRITVMCLFVRLRACSTHAIWNSSGMCSENLRAAALP